MAAILSASPLLACQLFSLHTLVVEIGFAREEVVVTEGSTVRVIAMLINITADNFQRFDDEFPVSTEDGTAIGMSSNTVQQVIFMG